jgi:hypothetical protein
VEWIEMQRLLGVEKFAMYIQSVGADVMPVLLHYSELGYLDLRSYGLIKDKIFKYPRSTAVSDCMYRYMHSHKMILVLDMDEVIVPTEDITLMQLVKQIAHGTKVPVRGSHFQFQNVVYYTDEGEVNADNSKPFYMKFMRYTHHGVPMPFPGPMKSIQDPSVCIYTSNHYCMVLHPQANKIFVPSDIAYVHHYKPCRNDQMDPWKCAKKLTNTTRDGTMLRYEKKLTPAVTKLLVHLKLI